MTPSLPRPKSCKMSLSSSLQTVLLSDTLIFCKINQCVLFSHVDLSGFLITNTLFKMLAIGNELYQKLVDNKERERQQNVTEVEKRAWRLASEEKARALKEAKEAAEMELEKAMAAAKKAQVNDFKVF